MDEAKGNAGLSGFASPRIADVLVDHHQRLGALALQHALLAERVDVDRAPVPVDRRDRPEPAERTFIGVRISERVVRDPQA